MATATLDGNKTVTATAKLKYFTITCGDGGVGQSIVIEVEGYGTLFNGGSFKVPYGTPFVASIRASEGYNIGEVSPAAGIVTENVTVTATQATLKTYTVSIVGDETSSVTIDCEGRDTVTDESMTDVPYGSTVVVTATPATGYLINSITVI